MKRKRLGIVVFILLCCMAAGCAKKHAAAGNDKEKTDPESKKSVQATIWLDAENGYANLYSIGGYESGKEKVKGNAELEQYYSDISWNIVDKSYLTPEQYRKELKEALDKGEGPDIIYMDTYNQISPQEMMESGRLAEIVDPADFYGEDMDYLTGMLESGQKYGKQYVLPIGVQCPVLFGIKKELDEAGIDTKNGYTSLQELLTALLDAQEATGRYIFENTQAADWLEQYYVEKGDGSIHELLDRVREHCGSDNSTFAAYDALDSKKALLGGCGVVDGRKAGQNLCLLSKDQQPAFLYVPAADGVKRAVVTQAVGVNAQSEHAAEISRALMMYRKNLWLAFIIGMGPYAEEREYWEFTMNGYVYSAEELNDRRYASRAAKLPDKTTAAYRKLVSESVQEALYAVQPSGELTAGQGSIAASEPEQERKVISVLYSDLGLGEDSGTTRWLRQAAEDFNASQKEYYVHLMHSGEATLMLAYKYMMEAGTEPDIVFCFPMYEGAGFQYADMSGFLKQHSTELSFLPDIPAIDYGGVVSGLPYAAKEYGIWCNKKTLRSAGLPEGWEPEDMQELTDGLRQLKSLEGIRTAAVLDGDFVKYLYTFMEPEQLDTYLRRNDEGEWQVSAQVWAGYMEILQQLKDEELAVPSAWRGAGITTEEAAAGLARGTVGAVLSDNTFGGWYDGAHGLELADGQREQLVFVPLAPMADMNVFCISARSQYPEAAAEFWLYAVSHESYGKAVMDDGMVPLTQLSNTVQAAMPCQTGGADVDDIVNGLWQLEKAAGEIAAENQWFGSMEE